MNKQGLVKVVLVVALLGLTPMSGWAAGQDGSREGRKGPPPEAFAACEGKAAGDSVEFSGRRGENIEATCQEKDGKLVAVPKNRPEGAGRQ